MNRILRKKAVHEIQREISFFLLFLFSIPPPSSSEMLPLCTCGEVDWIIMQVDVQQQHGWKKVKEREKKNT